MNITKNTTDKLNAVLTVTVDKADYQEKVVDVLNQYRKTANIKGFRKGQVPMSFVKKQYEQAVIFDTVNEILQKSVSDYINTEKLSILGNPVPVIKDVDWDADQLSFDFELGLAPEFDVDLSKVEVESYKVKVADDEIQKYVDNFASRFGSLKSLTEAEAEAVLKVEAAVEGQEAKPTFIRLEELKDASAFIGKKVGDVVEVNSNDIFDTAEEAAQQLNTEVSEEGTKVAYTIKEINKAEKAEVNQELFDKVYGEGAVDTEEAFRNKIKEESENMYNKESDKQIINDVVAKLLDTVKFDLPTEFLTKWLITSNENVTSEEQAKEELTKMDKGLRYQLIEAKIAEVNNVEVNAEEVKEAAFAAIKDQLKMYGQTSIPEETLQQIAMSALQNQEEYNRLSYQVFTDKMLDIFKNNVKLNEKEVTFDEFVDIITEKNKELAEA
ncbi:trigger factor [Empedobacter brevis]|uniref:Peptidylprolyl isomerase n=2 Tax=Empedobacter brevis TaxID=247 RepID=A0A511NFK1_9FLAO|nr:MULTISPECIES: trigger factor [Empedobacter]MDM1072727.1 trigger factor [Empedobacter brevis]QES92747.1 trigger factor [Empedobacter brevis]QHC84502.1 trigger factor [Empedobacter brevis]GEM51613.1 peptidylprolyl isomerase [Empedobacter brevis NBRC 14943 = ATCC 43319]